MYSRVLNTSVALNKSVGGEKLWKLISVYVGLFMYCYVVLNKVMLEGKNVLKLNKNATFLFGTLEYLCTIVVYLVTTTSYLNSNFVIDRYLNLETVTKNKSRFLTSKTRINDLSSIQSMGKF